MRGFRCFILHLVMAVIVPTASALSAEPEKISTHSGWKTSVGSALIIAPAFTGSKRYNLLAVPDIRVAYKDLFFANARDGVGYAVLNQDGWRVGPVITYTFSRSEKDGGSVFRIAGSRDDSLRGMGDVPGTVSLGGFAEYDIKPYKLSMRLHKGLSGHNGLVAEGKVNYGGMLVLSGRRLVYSFGPHIKFGDQTYVNAYWGVSAEQSARSGLARYHADAGVTAYGINGFAMTQMTDSISISMIAGFDRLASTVADSPLVQIRGSKNQAMFGLSISYLF
ncbi:MAG: MipA/OmpV family protein [Geobacteraceae bacterium]|nr:MipA/OmpV family protein [Geobacteraceae bacterium]NTW81038.1 MipA/OmpV family protein [Geobacteraceae bacterium]